jgi:parvulin-like peptidyl-prolyl isomerase
MQKQVGSKAANISKSQVEDFYKKNKTQFNVPEARTIGIVLAKNEAEAKKAKQEIDSGKSFAEVSKKYSANAQLKNTGQTTIYKNTPTPVTTAVFKAKPGELVGPAKTAIGWYIFKVIKTAPARTQSLKEVETQIKQQLIDSSPKAQTAVQNWQKSYQAKWKKLTECQPGYELQGFCKNAPEKVTPPAPVPSSQSTKPSQQKKQ